MAYRRKGREQWLVDLRTQTGWKKGVSTRTTSERLAGRIELMWETLATEYRAWDILAHVLDGRLSLGDLYDLWSETRQSLPEIRRRVADTDLEPLIADFGKWYAAQGVKPDTVDHVNAHVRWLIPEGTARLASSVTSAWLAERLASYPGKPNTRRKVHADWSTFFDYLTRVHRLFDRNPLELVDRPKKEKPPLRWYELDVIDRIVSWQPTERRRALFALLYGSPVEVSTALAITRADLYPATKEARAAGTKVHTRDRVVRIDEWAWPILWEYARTLLPAAPLFAGLHRRTVHRWHQETTGAGERAWKVIEGKNTRYAGELQREGLNLGQQLPVHNTRHAWAIRHLRAGVPVRMVQEQMGHATPKETLDTYGPFITSGADREKWALHVQDAEKVRREAK